MNYQEWIALDEEQMASVSADDVINLLAELPYGMIEPDDEKQVKLNQFLVVVSTSGCLSHDFEFHQKISRIGNSIVNLMPDNTNEQSFALGVFSIFVTFANTIDQLKKGPANAE